MLLYYAFCSKCSRRMFPSEPYPCMMIDEISDMITIRRRAIIEIRIQGFALFRRLRLWIKGLFCSLSYHLFLEDRPLESMGCHVVDILRQQAQTLERLVAVILSSVMNRCDGLKIFVRNERTLPISMTSSGLYPPLNK